jgi:hypothetical protein
LNAWLIPQLEKMKPGSRIVSFDFDMCRVITPDKEIEVEVEPERWFQSRKRTIFLWKTPLKKDEKKFQALPKLRERE